MSQRYGQTITWGTSTAPQIFGGTRMRYSYREMLQEQLDDDESGIFRAALLHSKKAEISFEAKVTQASTNFLDLSAGAKIAVSGVSGGTILCRQAVERWGLFPQPKTSAIEATHYPDVTGGAGASAGTALSALTPDQASLGLLIPSGKLIIGTFGLTHASGVVHGLTLTQSWTLQEDDPSPAGAIVGVQAKGYQRRIELMLLATGTIPATAAELVITGAPTHAANFRNVTAEKLFESQRGMMYSISAFWIPPFAP